MAEGEKRVAEEDNSPERFVVPLPDDRLKRTLAVHDFHKIEAEKIQALREIRDELKGIRIVLRALVDKP